MSKNRRGGIFLTHTVLTTAERNANSQLFELLT